MVPWDFKTALSGLILSPPVANAKQFVTSFSFHLNLPFLAFTETFLVSVFFPYPAFVAESKVGNVR